METGEEQPLQVHNEKCLIYDPTIPYYLDKYHLTSIKVIGLLIGARGTIPRQLVDFSKQFHLSNAFLKDLAITAVRGSLKILEKHLYFF